ncbi:MAG: sulfite exporter TauE/SafE family protein [Candidatus Omnitrophica bacterium]|nr:sulfite exporter TauE/SafE family protein [Candidatus Omnitrophota bacterium]
MNEILAGFITALWLGILTSISPCPLATNIAAVSFLSKTIVHPRAVLLSGLVYTFGRMLAYTILGVLIIKSLLSVPAVANFLQRYMNQALGPILIVVGIFLLDIFKLSMPSLSLSQHHQSKLAHSGLPGACALGFIFALAFCPVSAALFFGSLMPLAMNAPLGMGLPLIYGVGTALPVILFAIGIAAGATTISLWFHKLTAFERYTRKATGIVFIIVGIYYILSHLLHLI